MKIFALVLLVLVAFLAAAGNLCFKKAAVQKSLPFLKRFLSGYYLVGIGFFVVCPILTACGARFVDFSVMYAMTSLNFVFVLLLSRIFLKETIDRYKIGGVTLILAGIMLVVFS